MDNPVPVSGKAGIANAFTPGPWAVHADNLVAAAGAPLAHCYSDHNALANAHLIAAAPELYEALAEIALAAQQAIERHQLDETKALGRAIIAADAALAKARGQS